MPVFRISLMIAIIKMAAMLIKVVPVRMKVITIIMDGSFGINNSHKERKESSDYYR